METPGELKDTTRARMLRRAGIASVGFREGTSPYVITLDSGAKLFLTQRQAEYLIEHPEVDPEELVQDMFPAEWPED